MALLARGNKSCAIEIIGRESVRNALLFYEEERIQEDKKCEEI